MKVSIVCGAPSSEFLAPFEDESWEIWVLGNRLDRFKGKRVTKVFEIHDDLSEHPDPNKYVNWLVSKDLPLVVGPKFPIKSKKIDIFPYEEVLKLSDFVTLSSSPAYMIAYAILEGATEIGIYGVDMAVDDHEYFWQRPCMWGWVRFAEARGIKITIPQESALCKMDYIEGKDWKGEFSGNSRSQFAQPPFTECELKEMADFHQEKINALYAEISERERLIQTHDGCRQAYDRMSKVARAIESGQSNLSLKTTVSLKG